MGVPKLWELVQPSGCYVELKDLEGQTLAIDASIWIHSFLRAFKDSRGDPAENAHLLGFFWRICKLLQHRIKPIFVFDGSIPYLKQRTINERRKRRENSIAQAEKNQRKLVLLNTIKAQINKSKGAIDESQFDNLFNDLDQDVGVNTYDYDNDDDVDSDLEILDYHLDYNTSHLTLPSKDVIDRLFPDTMATASSSINSNSNDVFEIEDDDSDVDNDYLNNNNDPRNFTANATSSTSSQRVFTIEDGDEVGEYESQFVHNFNSEEIDQQVFSQLPQDIQMEVLSQMKQEKKIQDKISLLTPPKTPIDFSKHQVGSLLEKGKLTRKMNEVREIMQSEVKAYSTDGDTVFMLHKTPTPSKLTTPSQSDDASDQPSANVTPFSTPLKSNTNTSSTLRSNSSSSSLSERISTGNLTISPKSNKKQQQQQSISSILNNLSGSSLNSNTTTTNDKSDMYSKLDMLINRKTFLEPKSKAALPASPSLTLTSSAPTPYPSPSPVSLTSTTTTSTTSLSTKFSSPLSKLSQTKKSMFGGDSSPSHGSSDASAGLYYGDEDAVDTSSKRNLLDELFGSIKKKPIATSSDSSNSNNEENDIDFNEQLNVSEDNNSGDGNGNDYDDNDDDIPDFNQRIVESDDIDSFRSNQPISSITAVAPKPKPTTISTSTSPFKMVKEVSPSPTKLSTTTTTTTSTSTSTPSENVKLHLQEDDDIDNFVGNSNINSSQVMESKKKSEFDDLDIFDIPDSKDDNEIVKDKDAVVVDTPVVDVDTNANANVDINVEPVVSPVDVDEQVDGSHGMKVMATGRSGVVVRDDGVVINVPKFNSLELQSFEVDADGGSAKKDKPIFEYFSSKEAETLNRELELEKISSTHKLTQQIKNIKTIDDAILRECHDLLTLFGIPFITSPTEAEAQCAELFSLGLIDGVVTEDSDTLLFSKSSSMVVYRHLFQKPEKYCMSDIETKLGLNRNDLINLALLLGCDYTAGIKGVGIVNAMEIISEFSTLEDFAKFINKGKRKGKGKGEDGEDEDEHENGDEDDALNEERYRFRSLLKGVKLPDSFPSEQVKMAFYSPDVNTSKEQFAWSCPDLDSLRKLTQDKFGWDKLKIDNILLPILKLTNTVQSDNAVGSVVDPVCPVPSKFKSKRLTEAIERLIIQKSSPSTPSKKTSTATTTRKQKKTATKSPTPTKSKRKTTPTKKSKANKDASQEADDLEFEFDFDDASNNHNDIDLDIDSSSTTGPKDIDLDDDNGDNTSSQQSEKTNKKKKKTTTKRKSKGNDKEDEDADVNGNEDDDKDNDNDKDIDKTTKSKTPPKKQRRSFK